MKTYTLLAFLLLLGIVGQAGVITTTTCTIVRQCLWHGRHANQSHKLLSQLQQ
jgi:hypothetical protein